MMDEFPHEVIFQIEGEKVSDGGGGWIPGEWTTYDTIQGFLDTPKSSEIFQAQQLQHPFDRHLYYPYRTDIKATMRVVCESDTYELAGKPLDQGGQHEVVKVNLRLVPNG